MSKEAMKLRTAAEKVVELCSERPLSLGKWFIDMSEACDSLREALAEQPAQDVPEVGFGNTALDKKAENARELGLDYEPVQCPICKAEDSPYPKCGCVTYVEEKNT